MGEAMSTTLGRYELVERLAMGGMAELFKATMAGAHDFEKTVAIKKILPRLAADPEFVKMFITEANVLSLLQHPKIVQIFELGTSDDELFIAMEFVHGIDLLRVLRTYSAAKQLLPDYLAVQIICEVLDALEYAHSAVDESGAALGVVHRDISPGNILLSRGGVVKLTDFGIVRVDAEAQKTQSGTLKGKYSYMSPEQVVNTGLDGRSDLFSVAIVLTEILMCRRLFVAPSELDLLIMVREVNLERLDKHGFGIHPELRLILDKAFQRKPEDRYQTAREFRDALGDWQFDAGKRVTSADLAELVRTVMEPGDDGREEFAGDRTATMSGHTTQRKRAEAEQAATAARESLIELAIDGGWNNAGEDGEPQLELEFDDDDDQITADRDEPSLELDLSAVEGDEPDHTGDFSEVSPIRAIFEIAARGSTGLLIARKKQIVKQVYFLEGEAQFVDSNVPGERFGAFLVANEVITEDELSSALRVLPQFDGRLGDALIQLGMLNPMRALRWQTEQVRAKIIDIATWVEGQYEWYQGKTREVPEGRVLHLDAFDILGAASQVLDVEYLAGWAHQRAQLTPRAAQEPAISPTAFRVGWKPQEILDLLDGTRSLFDLNASFTGKEDRIEAMRLLYLLIHTGLAGF